MTTAIMRNIMEKAKAHGLMNPGIHLNQFILEAGELRQITLATLGLGDRGNLNHPGKSLNKPLKIRLRKGFLHLFHRL